MRSLPTTNWGVEVQRTSLDRRNLHDLLLGLGFSLHDGEHFPELCSQDMHQCNTAADVFELAKRARAAFAGPAQVDPDFALGSVVDYRTSPPKRSTFLEVQSCVMTSKVGTPTVTVGPPAGLTPEKLEAWKKGQAELAYRAKLEAQRARLEPAYREQRAVKLLEYMAIDGPSAEVLYKMYELVEEHPKRRAAVHAQFGITKSDFMRFQDAVHNPTVSGDWARHAYHDTPRTPDPMTKSEAESFVRAIAAQWLKQLRTSTSP
jgi:hypothetical protein